MNLTSRGLLRSSLVSSIIHWDGLRFLKLSKDPWLTFSFVSLTSDQLLDIMPRTNIVLYVEPVILKSIHRFSSLTKKATSFDICFLVYSSSTSTAYLHQFTEILGIGKSCIDHHATKSTILSSDLPKQLNNNSIFLQPFLAQLAPYIKSHGVIRVSVRLCVVGNDAFLFIASYATINFVLSFNFFAWWSKINILFL